MSHTDVKLSHRRCRGGLLSLLRTLQQVGYLVPGAKAVPDQDLQVTDEPKVCVYVCVCGLPGLVVRCPMQTRRFSCSWLPGFSSGLLPESVQAQLEIVSSLMLAAASCC